MRTLEMRDFRDIVSTYLERRERFPAESEEETLLIVLLNWGDKFTQVSCVLGEWQGTKSDLIRKPGIPTCPNGHPCLEGLTHYTLGLVEQTF